MHARTLYNIISTQVTAGAHKALAALAVLFLFSCSSQTTIEEVEDIDPNGKDPLNFTCFTEDSEQQQAATRAGSSLLTMDFMESTYKAYNTTNQYPVMENYHVEYKTTGSAWDGNIRPYWDYTGVAGQYEKYWDYSAFPYRFHAVAPYPSDPSVITLGDVSLQINATYKMQTVHNGMVTPTDAEPYLVAQMQRNADGHDYDYMSTSTTGKKEVNTTSTSRNRYVALPFHHLNSKVRFAIYSVTPWTTDNPLYIDSMTIKVTKPGFITQASGYQATGDPANEYLWYRGTGNSGFTGLTSSSDPTTVLLRFDGGKEVADNDLSEHQGRSSAFWLQCKDGIMQIPQKDVTISVSFKLKKFADDSEYMKFENVPIHLEDGTTTYNWKSGYLHTYYLIIGEVDHSLEITFTATLTPWEDVTGSLTTDLEQ